MDGQTEVLQNAHLLSTPNGNLWDPAKPGTLKPCISEIARGLAGIKRYIGIGPSVAAHSIVGARMMENADPIQQMLFLMHDSQETYVSDIPAPIKHALRFGDWAFAEYESILHRKILIDLVGIDPDHYPEEMAEVKRMDEYLVRLERPDLFEVRDDDLADYTRLLPRWPAHEFLEFFGILKEAIYSSDLLQRNRAVCRDVA